MNIRANCLGGFCWNQCKEITSHFLCDFFTSYNFQCDNSFTSAFQVLEPHPWRTNELLGPQNYLNVISIFAMYKEGDLICPFEALDSLQFCSTGHIKRTGCYLVQQKLSLQTPLQQMPVISTCDWTSAGSRTAFEKSCTPRNGRWCTTSWRRLTSRGPFAFLLTCTGLHRFWQQEQTFELSAYPLTGYNERRLTRSWFLSNFALISLFLSTFQLLPSDFLLSHFITCKLSRHYINGLVSASMPKYGSRPYCLLSYIRSSLLSRSLSYDPITVHS